MQPPTRAVSATERDRELRKIIGKRIRELRVARRWTQQESADAVSVSRRSFQRWEAGEDAPDASQILKLARHFEVEPSQFLTDGAAPEWRASVNVAALRTLFDRLKKRGS